MVDVALEGVKVTEPLTSEASVTKVVEPVIVKVSKLAPSRII